MMDGSGFAPSDHPPGSSGWDRIVSGLGRDHAEVRRGGLPARFQPLRLVLVQGDASRLAVDDLILVPTAILSEKSALRRRAVVFEDLHLAVFVLDVSQRGLRPVIARDPRRLGSAEDTAPSGRHRGRPRRIPRIKESIGSISRLLLCNKDNPWPRFYRPRFHQREIVRVVTIATQSRCVSDLLSVTRLLQPTRKPRRP